MKNLLQRLILLTFLIIGTGSLNMIFADAPPPPPAEQGTGGDQPPGGGAPIGEGAALLCVLASGYGLLKRKSNSTIKI